MPPETTAQSPKRIVVTGARGYIGSRLVPELLRQGHEVVATASSDPSGAVVPWADDVEWAVMDALDAGDVAAAVKGADAVCYLIHALDKPGFSNLDRQAADIMREAVDTAEVPRLVYLSGLVPDLPHDQLSHHLSSRLEVEEVLLRSRASVTSLRAGVVLGAGSTSFEIIRQLAATMLVQPVPSWLTSQIQPIAVADTVQLLAHALDHADPVGAVDVGGPDVLPYPELLALFAQEAGLRRLRLPVPPVPVPLVLADRTAVLRRAVAHRLGAGGEPAPRHGLRPGPGLGPSGRRHPGGRGHAPGAEQRRVGVRRPAGRPDLDQPPAVARAGRRHLAAAARRGPRRGPQLRDPDRGLPPRPPQGPPGLIRLRRRRMSTSFRAQVPSCDS